MDSISALLSTSAKVQRLSNRSNAEFDTEIKVLIISLRQSLSSKAVSSVAHDPTLLDQFDPSIDSITYLFLLRLQVQTLQEASQANLPADLLPSQPLWSKCIHYLRYFNPVQARYVGHEWRQIIEIVAQAAQVASRPLLAAKVIRDAMLRLDPSCAVFTSTHLLLVRLCLYAKAYTCALPVLNRHICHLPGPVDRYASRNSPALCANHDSSLAFITEDSGHSAKLTSRDLIRYFLYSGMVYLALKKWSEASHFLELAMSMPTTGPVSMIMVEAYKKWVLVGLLETGKMRPTPSAISSNVSRVYQSIAKPYVNLAHAFELGDLNRLNAEIDAAKHIWSADNNMGLILQVRDSFLAHALVGIKKVFAALTVAELSEQTSSLPRNPDAAESAIASLIMSGTVSAKLVHASTLSEVSMLRFPSTLVSSQSLHELEVQGKLAKEGQILETLIGSIKRTNNAIGLGDDFIDHMLKGPTWNGAGEGFAATDGDAGLDMDEDLMGDES